MAKSILSALGSALGGQASTLGSLAGRFIGAPSGMGGLGAAIGGAALPAVSYLGQAMSPQMPSVRPAPYTPQPISPPSASQFPTGDSGWQSPFLPRSPSGGISGGGGTYTSGAGGGGWSFGGYNPAEARRKAEQSRLVGQWNKAFAQAKAANLKRYQQMLNIANKTTAQRATDIRSDYAGQAADLRQQMMRTGMANTPGLPVLERGVERYKQEALNRLADAMQQTKLGIIERRQDKYPDLTAIASLAQIGGFGGLRF